MRLTIKEPHIELYKDGFDGNCKLGRKETGKQLSQLVEDFDESLVIALDGAWGSGKSFFLKCWVGQHLQDYGASTQTVYFDAFQHDYLDDPLIALTLRVKKILEKDNVTCDADDSAEKARRQKRKEAAIRLGKAALRVGAAVATFGATEHLGDLGDAAALAIKDEALNATNLESPEEEKFWEAQHARVRAMDEFKAGLTLLTSPDDAGSPTQKLVIVIDELDRCRPDYALSLLEIIKHFFAVDGVHFVLGVNLKELQNSVKARYGAGVDAALYLQKFYSFSVPLPKSAKRGRSSCSLEHYLNIVDEFGTSEDWMNIRIEELLSLIPLHQQLSLREVERIATLVAVCPEVSLKNEMEYLALALLTIFSAAKPSLLEDTLVGNARVEDLLRFLGLTSRDSNSKSDRSGNIRYLLYWLCMLTQNPEHDLVIPVDKEFAEFGLNNTNRHKRQELLPNLFNQTLGTFNLPR